MTFGELFAGVGGFSLGLERAGMTCKWQVEIDPYASAVLKKHWPKVPKWDDVRTFPPQGDWGVDLICGGFPCQDISYAGKGAGLAGARSGLWCEFARVIGELRPRYVVVENVAALLTRGMGAVLGTLSALGYDAEWHVIPASAVGAPHRRDRVWVVCVRCRSGTEADASRPDPNGLRSHTAEVNLAQHVELRHEQERVAGSVGGSVSDADSGQVHRIDADTKDGGEVSRKRTERFICGSSGGDDVAYAKNVGDSRKNDKRETQEPHCKVGLPPQSGRSRCIDQRWNSEWWRSEPDVGRVAHGVSSRVDRLRCLGNAVVPQIVEIIGRAIIAHEEALRSAGGTGMSRDARCR